METVIFALWVFGGIALASWVGYRFKGRPMTGFFLGLFFGWLGAGVTALLPPTREHEVAAEMHRQQIRREAGRRE